MTTRITTGASLKPDSASSIPVTRRGSGTRRSTENTAAASVEDSTAPTSSAFGQRQVQQEVRRHADDADRHERPRRSTSTAAGATESRMPDHDVVRPPSARIRTRAL